MTPWKQFALVWALAAIAQAIAWGRQQRTSNAGIVDVVWSFGLGADPMTCDILSKPSTSTRSYWPCFTCRYASRSAHEPVADAFSMR